MPHRLSLLLVVVLAACGRRAPPQVTHALPPSESFPAPERCAERHPERVALFGDLHVHTALSLDAHLQGTRLAPDDAYRFARGEPVAVRGAPGGQAQLERPLDFAAITDHAEFLGVVEACVDPATEAFRTAGCRLFRRAHRSAFVMLNARLTASRGALRYPELCGPRAHDCVSGEATAWRRVRDAAERHLDRSGDCAFTTFIAYEWSASPLVGLRRAANLHRNVIFRDHHVPDLPASYLRTGTLEGLFEALEVECLGAGFGCDALSIPHNANLSAGTMFRAWGETLGDRWSARHARRRSRFEPLMELIQHKGASECVPGTALGDERCGFELVPYRDLAQAKRDQQESPDPAGTLRHGLTRGLALGALFGVNPFEVGVIGSTDTHLGLPGAVDEHAFLGGGGAGESGSGTGSAALPDRAFFSGGGLAGVWAEENARDAIFDALRRRETFATSGTRLRVRTFLGDAVPEDFCAREDRVAQGYATGVPMGARLPQRARAPRLGVIAEADPGTDAHPGAPLARLEVVRGRLGEGGHVTVDVVPLVEDEQVGGDPLEAGCAVPEGPRTLCATWSDPDFDADRPAFYYVRVLEAPTCRWTTRACLGELPLDCVLPASDLERACCAPAVGLHPPECTTVDCARRPNDPCCEEARVEAMIQERAWSSPIYTGPEGLDLAGRGATPERAPREPTP
ncbi:MAG: DUF3604 domain-containing protein [Myxococcota bacterium]